MDNDASSGPRLRTPRSSLAVGRRFRLLARSPLPGAGVLPRIPAGFVARGREAGAPAPTSPFEKVLVVPSLENGRSRDLAWSEARWAADVASEAALLVSMMLPTETAPERKQEAQRLHDRALKVATRVEAAGPQGTADPAALAAEVRGELQPTVAFLASCQHEQETGVLQALAWPSLLAYLREGLEASLARLDAAAAGAPPQGSPDWVRREAPRLAMLLRLAARFLDPSEEKRVTHMRDLARGLLGLDPAGEPREAEAAAQGVVDELTRLAVDVEQARVRSILNPLGADHLRREAVKSLDDLQRTIVAAAREA